MFSNILPQVVYSLVYSRQSNCWVYPSSQCLQHEVCQRLDVVSAETQCFWGSHCPRQSVNNHLQILRSHLLRVLRIACHGKTLADFTDLDIQSAASKRKQQGLTNLTMGNLWEIYHTYRRRKKFIDFRQQTAAICHKYPQVPYAAVSVSGSGACLSSTALCNRSGATVAQCAGSEANALQKSASSPGLKN